MSSLIKTSALRTVDLGVLVTRAAATLPQTALQNIYTVTGGRVLITGLVGLVTVATGATVTTLTIGTVPTVGTAGAASLASATAITSREIGTMMTLGVPASGIAGGALIVGATAASVMQAQISVGCYLVPAGAVSITTSASDTGQIQWDLTYIPFDTGASVAAA